MADVPTDPRKYLPGGPQQHRQAGIIAAFLDPSRARDAAAELEAAGYPRPDIEDDVNPQPVDRADLRQEGFPRTLPEEPRSERDEKATGEVQPPGKLSRTVTVLTVAVDGDRYEPARSIIRKHGGKLDGV